MNRILAAATIALLATTGIAAAQKSDPAGRPMDPAGISNKTPDGRPMDPAGISSKTPDGRPIDPAGISGKGAAPAPTGNK